MAHSDSGDAGRSVIGRRVLECWRRPRRHLGADGSHCRREAAPDGLAGIDDGGSGQGSKSAAMRRQMVTAASAMAGPAAMRWRILADRLSRITTHHHEIGVGGISHGSRPGSHRPLRPRGVDDHGLASLEQEAAASQPVLVCGPGEDGVVAPRRPVRPQPERDARARGIGSHLDAADQHPTTRRRQALRPASTCPCPARHR